MAVPQRRKSKAKKNSRRAQHDKITLPTTVQCAHCGADVLPHTMCQECGYYDGRVVLEPVIQEIDEELEA